MGMNQLRKDYHTAICLKVFRITKPEKGKQKGKTYPNIADSGNASSIAISWALFRSLGGDETSTDVVKSTGSKFETVTMGFIKSAFELLQHLRPGDWEYSTTRTAISNFEQFEHLAALDKLVSKDKGLKKLSETLGSDYKELTELIAGLSSDYIVKPDIVISRHPVSDAVINQKAQIVGDEPDLARYTPFRERNRNKPSSILHASISCKWTIRSDRSQNTRTEALNLVRNRKGALPHIVAVTAEPLPTRIAALALGTGDLDCVYHFALPELIKAVKNISNADQLEVLEDLIRGRRLRDIGDLPFDLAI